MAKAKNKEITVKSVTGFIRAVKKIKTRKSNLKKHLYRGLPDSEWMILSTLELNMRKKRIGRHSVIQEYTHNQALIYHAKYHDFDKTQNESSKTHLGSLAHMRHYGAATSLIDFTGEPLVALCFACQPNRNKKDVLQKPLSNQNSSACQSNKETDGVVYRLDIYKEDEEFMEITKDEQLKEWTIDKILKATSNCFYWKPPAINKRIMVQDSYFIIGPKNFYNLSSERVSKIVIPAEYKETILDELSDKHNISIDKFFDDMLGFAELNSYDSNYSSSIPLGQRAENYLTSSINMIKTEARILGNKLSEKESKELFNLYNDRGNIHLGNGKYRKAAQDFKKAIKYYETDNKSISDRNNESYPSHVESYYNLGYAKLCQKEYQQAIKHFTEAIKIYEETTKDYKQNNKNTSDNKTEFDTDYAESYYNRGSAKLGLKEYQQAIKDFDAALKIKDDHAKALNRIGMIASASGDSVAAESYYTRALAADKEFSEAYLNRGIVRLKRGREKLAKSDFKEALELDDKYAEAYNAYGLALCKQRKYEKAIEYFDIAIKIQPKYLKALSNRGAIKGLLGEHQEAIEDFTKAIETDSGHAQSYYNRGTARGAIGEYKKAIEDYDKMLKLEPSNHKVLNIRGKAKIRAQMHNEAIEDFTKALEIDPRYASAYNNRGLVSGKQKDYSKAIDDFTKAIEIDPSYAAAYYNRGLTREYLAKDNDGIKDSIKDYEHAIKLNARYIKALQKLGESRAKLGEHKEAIKCFDKIIRLNPDYVQVYNNRASSKIKLGYNDEAIKDLKTITEKRPQDPWGYYALGRLKNSLHSYREALEFLSIAKNLIHIHNHSSEYKEISKKIEEIINTIDCIPKK